MHRLIGFFTVLWGGAILLGFAKLWRYEGEPSPTATPKRERSIESAIQPRPGHFTLIMAAHPKCPCTRASLREIAKVLAHSPVPVDTYVVFYHPLHTSPEWAKTESYALAKAIRGVDTLFDEGGREAKRFHAVVSGQTLLYDSDGRLLFSGGITSARGHEGDNKQEAALMDLLNRRTTQPIQTPVFGCSLAEGFSR